MRFLGFLIFLLSMLFVMDQKAIAQDKCETIKIAHASIWPPIAYSTEDNSDLGIAIDIQREAFGRLGIDIEFVPHLPWKRQFSLVADGQIDALASLYFNEDRAKKYVYTDPYYRSNIVAFASKDSDLKDAKISSLKNYKGGMILGSSYGPEYDRNREEYLNIHWVNSTNLLFQLLQRGRTDYVVIPEELGLAYLKNKDIENIAPLPEVLAVENIHMGFSRKSPCKKYADLFNKTLATMREDGTVVRIINEGEKLFQPYSQYRDVM